MNKIKLWLCRIRNWIFIDSHLPKAYSFEQMLTEFLVVKRPKRILEFGVGRSTMLMKNLLPGSEIYSIEDDWRWYLRWLIAGLDVHYDNNNYSSPDFPDKYFDFVFIDGKDEERQECMGSAFRLLKDGGFAMLHDTHKFFPDTELFKVIKDYNYTALMEKKHEES